MNKFYSLNYYSIVMLIQYEVEHSEYKRIFKSDLNKGCFTKGFTCQ